jgi:CrcB protein
VNYVWVALGGAVGSACRYGVAQLLAEQPFPFATLTVNVVGSLVLGVVTELALRDPRIGPVWVGLLGAGFCGGFTTMSTFTVETLRLPLPSAAANVAANLGTCLLAAWLGIRLARGLHPG